MGTLFGIYMPLVHYPEYQPDYSLMDSSSQLGTPGVGWLIAGSILLLAATVLLLERVQTPAKLGAVLVLACLECVGCVFAYAVAFTLIWSDGREFTEANRGHHFVQADFRYGAVVAVLSCGLMLAGALWWYVDAHRARETLCN
ncbi:hypothetical protein GFY24_39075 [Nocardia sp. SYP-A9097]|uniref:hypothetical protein n=1 Tax=Nocardia sp. SYP-A9097 TaxID=2663237 RepID=UPI00129B7743|nr:hypothetical protein [Nocardia sp. SYP-A9097]MRH93353.1 hypothetical protein [Nocardia sp. SYP-A9097]